MREPDDELTELGHRMDLRLREAVRDLRAQLLRTAVALALLVSLFVPVAWVERTGYGEARLGSLPDLVAAQPLAIVVLIGGLATVVLLALSGSSSTGPRRSAAVTAGLTLLLTVILIAVRGPESTGRVGEWHYEAGWGIVPLLISLALGIAAALRRGPGE